MGTRLILVTAAHESIAKKVSEHFKIFESFLASSDTHTI